MQMLLGTVDYALLLFFCSEHLIDVYSFFRTIGRCCCLLLGELVRELRDDTNAALTSCHGITLFSGTEGYRPFTVHAHA